MSDEPKDLPPIPPPTFEFLTLSLKMQAEVALGLLKVPGDDDGKDLVRARHVIDLLAMLAEKTKGNLTLPEQRLIENSLTELRFRFVQTSSAASQAPASPADTSPADTSPADTSPADTSPADASPAND